MIMTALSWITQDRYNAVDLFGLIIAINLSNEGHWIAASFTLAFFIFISGVLTGLIK